jgi:hypothetical protein
VWEVCANIMRAAEEQGAAVILGGDLNATVAGCARNSGNKAPDRKCQAWIREQGGMAAVNAAGAEAPGKYSWQDPKGRHDADIDHIVAFPSTIPLSHRRLLQPLEPGLDHLPVSVAFHTDTVGPHILMKRDPGIHHPRLQTTDFHEKEPELRQVLDDWWKERVESGKEKGAKVDDAMVQQVLQEAAQVYGGVSGWTKAPQGPRKRVLKGHSRLLRELDALFVGRRIVQQAVDACEQGVMVALNEGGMRTWQRSTLRHQVLKGALPSSGSV